ncbi:hypothetical protein [Glaciecola petra]|uniref:PEP-CTERM sorting domain-containing protein n=1 Tax=Glaciecola petra TaxID=3075602 RepID=A0ABU2ZRS5_9ALTE|nr:hypothetical protein [Aestuariibacter sp. P117]MDT0595101.1 hypothetical protein [Aestuariibacter sp. P117]
MKKFSTIMSVTFVCMLFFSAMSDARLIVRGGATVDIGSGETKPMSLVPLDRPQFFDGTMVEIPDGMIEDENIVDSLGLGPNNQKYAPIPYENRASEDVPVADRCDPSVCEFSFDINDPFQLQGFGTAFGVDKGVITSYEWSVFELSGSNGSTGNKIASFDATSVLEQANGIFDVFLDVAFPVSLTPGAYQLALSTTFLAPSGQEFAVASQSLGVEINGVIYDVADWAVLGQQFEFETQRYNLTITQNAVNAPSILILSSIMMVLVCARRRT